MWASPAVSPTSAMCWPSVLAGQLPLRSVLCRAVRGGTVLDHGLGILAGGNALRMVSAPPDVQFMPGLEILILANAASERLRFRRRLTKVEQHMNSDAFTALEGGDGLPGLARRLRTRCETLVKNKGERLPH
jgi:hypothetical protein